MILCILRPYFFSVEMGLTHRPPLSVWKIPHYFLNPSLILFILVFISGLKYLVHFWYAKPRDITQLSMPGNCTWPQIFRISFIKTFYLVCWPICSWIFLLRFSVNHRSHINGSEIQEFYFDKTIYIYNCGCPYVRMSVRHTFHKSFVTYLTSLPFN